MRVHRHGVRRARARAVLLVGLLVSGAGWVRAVPPSAELSAWFDPPAALWTRPASEVVTGSPPVFAWADATRTLARAPAGACTFLGLKTWDCTLRVQEDRPRGLEIVLYQRGDEGELAREAYVQRVRDTAAVVEKWAGGAGQKASDELHTAGVKRESLVWVRQGTRVRLSGSYSTKDRDGSFAFRAEYLRVTLEPATAAGSGAAGARPAAVRPPAGSGAAAARRAETRPNGDVVLTAVPMVDQGEKGYCSVATLERITRYYGLPIDQHELAQLAASDPSAGTDAHHLMEALQRVGPRIGLRARTLEEIKLDDAVRLIDRYNREAKRAGKPEIVTGRMIDLSKVYQQMDGGVLKEARSKDGGGRKGMLTDIQKALADGVPLVWSVILGKVAEIPALKQASGGHMRLIIGCNPKTNEILYSDSWGPGHEEKRMALDDAWTITLGRYRVEAR